MRTDKCILMILFVVCAVFYSSTSLNAGRQREVLPGYDATASKTSVGQARPTVATGTAHPKPGGTHHEPVDRRPVVPGEPTGIFPQSSSVSMGTYNYHIPIEVPPGRNGMEPSISLSYNSDSDHGMVGFVGWSISGLSRISLCPKTAIRDKKVDGINFDKNDNYCLDGVKLIEVDASYGTLPDDIRIASGATAFAGAPDLHVAGVYMPEDNTANLRVFALSETLGGKEFLRTWVVLFPNKLYRWYGESENSRMEAIQKSSGIVGHTIAWLLSGEEKNDNRIDYAYIEDPTDCQITQAQNCDQNTSLGAYQAGRYIKEIKYTRWTGSPASLYGGSSSLRSIRFNWASTDRHNFRDYWVNGIRVFYTQVLSSIDVLGPNSTKIREYKLTHSKNWRNFRRLLDTVTVCDTYDKCLPETTFTYTTTADPNNPYEHTVRFTNAYEIPLPFGNNPKQQPSSLLVADVNNDGSDDIMYINDPADPYQENRSYLGLSSGTLNEHTFDARERVNFRNFLNDKVFDFDMDRNLELMHSDPVPKAGNDPYHLWESPMIFDFYESDNHSMGTNSLTVGEEDVVPANVHLDLDGDQKQELILFKRIHMGAYDDYRLNIYSLEKSKNALLQWKEGFNGWQPWNTQYVSRYGGGFAHDINGDGRTDFVYYNAHPNAHQGRYLYIDDNGDFKSKALGFNLHNMYFMDVNGDHLPDAVELAYQPQGPADFSIRMNTGDGFTDPKKIQNAVELTSKDFAVHVADFNEDGRDDFLLLKWGQEPEIWYSDGDGFYFMGASNFAVPLLPHMFIQYHALPVTDVPQWKGKGYWKGINILDANGDGLFEVSAVSEGSDGDDSNFVIRMLTQTQSQQNIFADRLIKVEDGLGAVEQVQYSKLGDVSSPCENDETNAEPTMRKCINKGVVVQQLTQQRPKQADKKTQYKYYNAQLDMYGRGFLGYEKITETDPHSGYVTIYRYDLTPRETIAGQGIYAYPFKSNPFETEFRMNSGSQRLYTETRSWTPVFKPMMNGVYKVLTEKRSTTKVMNKHSGSPSVHLSTQYSEFDSYDYPRKITTEVTDGYAIEEKIEYDHNYSQSLLGLPKKMIQTHTSPKGGSGQREIALTYTQQGDLDVVIVEPDSMDPDIYEEIDYNYYPGGLIKKIERKNKTATLFRSADFEWTPDGAFLTKQKNALGHTTSFKFLPEFGVLHKHKDPNGITYTQQYDSFGRLVKHTDPDGSYVTYDYTHYDADFPYAVKRTGSAGDWNEVRYNNVLQPTRISWQTFDGAGACRDVEYNYFGDILTQSMPYPMGSNPSNTFIHYGYDDIDVLTSIKYPGGSGGGGEAEEKYGYKGFTEKTYTDAMGRDTKIVLSPDNYVQQIERKIENGSRITTMQYDVFGQLTGMEEDPSSVASTQYDIRGRAIKHHEPDAGWYEFKWNPFGDLIEQKRVVDPDPNGQPQNGQYVTKTISYDSLGRVNQIVMNDSVTPFKMNEYHYDAPGAVGFLATASRDNDGNGSFDVQIHYAYDSFGREIKNTYNIKSEQYDIAMGYDSHGRVKQMEYPEVNGTTMKVRYVYNSHGFLKRIEDMFGQKLWEALEYDLNQIKKVRKGNNILTELEYYAHNRLLKTIKTGNGTGELYHKQYVYYPNGQAGIVTDSVNNITERITYDSLDRVEDWNRIGPANILKQTFTYDDARAGVLKEVAFKDNASNLIKKVLYDFADTPPHAVQTRRTFLYPGGSETLDAAVEYEYDTLGRETKSSNAGIDLREVVSFNGFDLPDRIRFGPDTFHFLYDTEGGEVAREKAGSNEKTIYIGDLYEKRTDALNNENHILYLYAPEGRIGEMVYDMSNPGYKRYYVEKDVQGTTDVILDENGNVLEQYFNSPYGVPLDQSGHPVDSIPLTTRLYADHAFDSTAGIYHMKARLYDPHKRRFTTTDPVFSGFDSYAYTHNDPVNRIDPDGRCDSLGNDCGDGFPPGPGDGPGGMAGSGYGGGPPNYGGGFSTPSSNYRRGPKAKGGTAEKTRKPGPGQTPNMGQQGYSPSKSKDLPEEQWDLEKMFGPRTENNTWKYIDQKYFGNFLSSKSGIMFRAIEHGGKIEGRKERTLTFEYLLPGRYGSGIENIMAEFYFRAILHPEFSEDEKGHAIRSSTNQYIKAEPYEDAKETITHSIRFVRTGKGLTSFKGQRTIAQARKWLTKFINNKMALKLNLGVKINVIQLRRNIPFTTKEGIIKTRPVSELRFVIPKGYKVAYPDFGMPIGK